MTNDGKCRLNVNSVALVYSVSLPTMLLYDKKEIKKNMKSMHYFINFFYTENFFFSIFSCHTNSIRTERMPQGIKGINYGR